jgi:hypothetical protein
VLADYKKADCVSFDKYGRQSQRFSTTLLQNIALQLFEDLKDIDISM